MPCENLKFKRVEIMNKSKFLKKSLAMVLAVMLVVAMIPLGASANSLFVNDGTVVSVEATVGTLEMGTGKSFTDTLTYDAAGNETLNVKLTGSLTNVVAIITDENGEDGDEAVAAGGAITVPVTAKKVVFFAADDAYVEGDEAGKTSATYTVTMNKPAPSTDVSVKSAKLGGNEGIDGVVDNGAKTITFTVPWGYNVAGDNGAVTAELNNPKTGVVPSATVSAIGENVSLPITSQYGNTDTYTVITKEMTCLTALSVGGVSAVLDDDEDSPTYGEYSVTLPEGTDLDEEQVVKYTVPSTATLRVTSAMWGGTELVGTNGKVTITDGAKVALVFTSSASTTKTYQVTVSVKKSNDASITGFVAATTVDGGAVYYDQEGTVTGDKLTVLLPYKADLATTKVKFTVAEGATITVGGGAFTNDGSQTIDLTAPKVVEVTAVDGVTKKYYEISATTAENPYGNPAITAAKLTIGEDEYTGTISGQTITFANLPYSTENSVVKVSGNYSWAKSFATQIVDGNPVWAEDPFTGTNTLAIHSDAGDMVTYTLKYTKAAAKTGKTVSNYTVSTAAKGENVAADNTWNVTFSGTKATVTLPYSFEANKATIDLISSFTLSDGAKLYFNDAATTTNLNTTPVESGYYAEDDADHPDDPKNTVKVDKLASIVVADEAAAVALSKEGGAVVIADMPKAAAYKGHVSIYTVEVKYAPAKTGHSLRSLTADDGKVTSKISGTTVEITVPYSYAQNGTAFFADYTADELAKVEAGSTVIPALSSVEDKTIDATGKLKVVMNGETPEIQVYNGSYSAFSTITVTNEANTASTPYAVTVKVADAKTGADVVELTANKTKAVIDTNKKTATVRLPYNTDLTNVVIDYKVSDLATAVVNPVVTPDEEGAMHYDATQPITITVTSENGATVKVYTVNVTAAEQFSDVPATGRYYSEYVYQAAAAGIVNGYTDGTFKPGNKILRKDFAVMVANMLGADVSSYTKSPFSDVANDYATKYIAYCADKGIISGTGNGKFSPNAYITREDAACIVARALKLPTTSTDSFKDAAKVSNYAKASVAACKAAGIFTGDEKGNFNPKANIIRADAAIIMVKSLNK